MAFTKTSTNKGTAVTLSETYTLPASGAGYTSAMEIPFSKNNNHYVSFSLNASAVSGTNLDIALYGADTETGTKTLLLDAVVADITATGKVTGRVDMNAYPAAFHFIGWTVDASETANTIAFSATIPNA